MENLLQLIQRFGSFLLFLVLEVLCLFLIVNFNAEQNRIFFSSANRLTGGIGQSFDNVVRYFNLGQRNRVLREDNARLLQENASLRQWMAQYQENALDTFPKIVPLNDSLRQIYFFSSARVINNSIRGQDNMLTLNRGSLDSIEAHTGVINGKGIVGVVTRTSKHYASVMSILNRQSRISAAIRSKAYFGTLTWNGRDPLILQLEAVPKHAEVNRGDTVVTSGFSHMFPPDIPIGTVDSIWLEPGVNFFGINVRLVNDLSQTRHVYICHNRYREELLELEEGVTYE